ncbi:hypothetical protein JSY36_04950 [Bacillus sp. H-16]|uniref:hypothetical protein n=1 Tax=Alteribacter salitolerans TaxID=2912333 RepID=UPI0019652F02|nr:hypothetical protein [Alteribacter salitolerans]MBM7095100.1 hypothetical protein [Alteribacter salitolerans]
MKKSLMVVGAFLLGMLVFLMMTNMGYHPFYFFPLAEFATKYVLPWVGLYWLIRLTKALERGRQAT